MFSCINKNLRGAAIPLNMHLIDLFLGCDNLKLLKPSLQPEVESPSSSGSDHVAIAPVILHGPEKVVSFVHYPFLIMFSNHKWVTQ